MQTTIDVDTDALAQAAQELGTDSAEETINAALVLVAGRRSRMEALLDDPFAIGTGPDIADDVVMRGSRR
ncbi:MAG: type II toxin-antitoxin system VapB family antitoxin [Sporichthyaceae bacterium]